MINELDLVVLTHDIDDHGLKSGDVGTVVQGKRGVALISLSKLQQIQEIEKSFRQLQRALLISRLRDGTEPGGTWEDFLAAIDEGLASDVVELPSDQLLAKIEAGVKINF